MASPRPRANPNGICRSSRNNPCASGAPGAWPARRHFWIDMSFASWVGRPQRARVHTSKALAGLTLGLGLSLGMGLSTKALAVDAASVGVNYPDTMRVEGVNLTLNGTGVAYRALAKLYTIGLYLPNKTSNATEVLDMSTPRRLRFVMLQGLRVDEIGKAITRGIELNSSRPEFFKLIPSIRMMGEQFAGIKRMNAGDVFVIEHVPQRGTLFLVNGEPAGLPITEPLFYPAILRTWIGPKPATQDLKIALLDQQPVGVLDALE